MYLFLCLKVGSASMEKVALILLSLMLRLPVYHICCSKTYIPLLRDFSKIIPSFFTIKKGFFSKTYPSFLTVKEGSTSHLGLLPSGKKRETALLGARDRYALRLADHQSSAPGFAGWDRLDLKSGLIYL